MRVPAFLIALFLTLTANSPALAAGGCYDGIKNCDYAALGRGPGSESSSTGGKVKINPAAVPTEDAFGIETITFKTETDFGLVRGNGRIGAAISPTNNEESFFGPPGFSLPQDLLERKRNKEKFPSQKITMATAFDLVKKKGSTFKSYSLKLGAMGRYNQQTYAFGPGMGLSGTLGPLSFGASSYEDQTLLDENDADGDGLRPLYRYQVRSYSLGLFLSSLVLDYSHLKLNTEELNTVSLYTASLYLKKFIFTVSKRVETSPNPSYNFKTQNLETQERKVEIFGGIQYALTKNLMIGALYNYYLLREYTVAGTLIF